VHEWCKEQGLSADVYDGFLALPVDGKKLLSLTKEDLEHDEDLGLLEEEQRRVMAAIEALRRPPVEQSEVSSAAAERKLRKAREKAEKQEKFAKKQGRILDQAKAVSRGGTVDEAAKASPLPAWVRVVNSLDDPSVQVYRDLKNAGDEARDGCFIAEGAETIRMVLRSSLETVSLMLKPSIFEKLREEIEATRGTTCTVLLCEASMMSELVGYTLQRGALGCARVPLGRDVAWLKRGVLQQRGGAMRILGIDKTGDAANLGGMVRSASAFGVDAVLISHDSCDPWYCEPQPHRTVKPHCDPNPNRRYRRAVRVSMGHVCRVPVVRCESLSETLEELRRECGVVSYAAVIDEDAPLLHTIDAVPKAWCLVMGNEDTGIGPEVREACTQRLRIHMEPGVDSLNIGVATGILLSGFRERELRAEAGGPGGAVARACSAAWW